MSGHCSPTKSEIAYLGQIDFIFTPFSRKWNGRIQNGLDIIPGVSTITEQLHHDFTSRSRRSRRTRRTRRSDSMVSGCNNSTSWMTVCFGKSYLFTKIMMIDDRYHCGQRWTSEICAYDPNKNDFCRKARVSGHDVTVHSQHRRGGFDNIQPLFRLTINNVNFS